MKKLGARVDEMLDTKYTLLPPSATAGFEIACKCAGLNRATKSCALLQRRSRRSSPST